MVISLLRGVNMSIEEYSQAKLEESYRLYKEGRFFKKSRALIINRNRLVVLSYRDGKKEKFVLPGGGIEEGEGSKKAAVRESMEEVGMKVFPYKFIGKEYYSCNLEYNGERFPSKRVTFYYLCKGIGKLEGIVMGLEGEFDKTKELSVKTLSYEDLLTIKPHKLNSMRKKTFEKFMEEFRALLDKKPKKKFKNA